MGVDLDQSQLKIRGKVAELESSLQDLHTTNSTIAREKARVEAILDSLGEGVLTVDSTGHTMYANEPAITLLGTQLRILGQDITKVMKLEDAKGDTVPAIVHPIHEAIRHKKRVAFGLTSGPAYFIANPVGQRRRISMTITPVLHNKKLTVVVVILRDITDENNMDRTKSEIVSIASHQLRTPLTAVRWYSKELISHPDLLAHDKQLRYLTQIYNSSLHMVETVNALLNVSRIDLGTLRLEPTAIKLDELLAEVLQELNFEIAQKDLRVKVASKSTIRPVMIDHNSLRIILQNLLANAVRYSPPGKDIDVVLEQQDNNVLVSIHDRGIGIPRSEQPKIFTKLFRASNAQKIEPDGSGLGLYLVKAMIDRANGRVWFESTEREGTTFYIVIPSAD